MEAMTETNSHTVKPEASNRSIATRFTHANARFNAAKSVAVRRLNPLNRFKPVEEPVSDADLFLEKQLGRIRTQLSYIDRLILRETQRANPDGKRLKDLAEAQDRLLDQLQRKPSSDSKPSSNSTSRQKPPEAV